MPNPTEMLLIIVSSGGTPLVEQSVAYTSSMTARGVLEGGFLAMQSPANPDPFEITIKYYGESESTSFPGFLGYEIESLCNLPATAQQYWELLINGTPSQTGADTTIPPPGSTVAWRYILASASSGNAETFAEDLHRRRQALVS